jgi:hypothetical protein
VVNILDSWLTTKTERELSGFANRHFFDIVMKDNTLLLYHDPDDSKKFNLIFYKKSIGSSNVNFWNFSIDKDCSKSKDFFFVNFEYKETMPKPQASKIIEKLESQRPILFYDQRNRRCLGNYLLIFPYGQDFELFKQYPSINTIFENKGSFLLLKLNFNFKLNYYEFQQPLISYYEIHMHFIGNHVDPVFRCSMPTGFTIIEHKEFNFLDKQFPFVREYLGKYSVVAAAGTILAAGAVPVVLGFLGYASYCWLFT